MILPQMPIERFAVLQWTVVAVALFWLLYLFGPVLAPFVAAGILAYICNPLGNRLCAWSWPRTLATLAVMLASIMLFGLHPLTVIFALLAFGQLFGLFGVLLALPLSAVLLALLRHGKSWYPSGSLYRG